ncbi:C39 family peptidase, partial [Nocardioides sp. XL1]
AAARPAGAPEGTGDLDAAAALAQRARLSPSARAAADRAELTMAARSLAKVWLLRHQIEGVPLPSGFLEEHPEARAGVPAARTAATASPTGRASATASSSPTAAPTRASLKTMRDYPRRTAILNPKQVAAQNRTYWCGPTSMQMIAWGWRDRRQTQGHWARRLHTTSSGSSVYDMVRVVNQSTGWDREDHAGPYIVLDISHYDFRKWMLLMMRHLADYRAPVVLHPVLLKRFYPYLDDDASGHFQVGRGYAKRGAKPDLLGYFEPWNQQRFDPSEPYISRVQWRNAYKSYRANQAHFGHNVGV